MSNETTVTTLQELVNSELISDMILDYAVDNFVIYPLVWSVDLAGQATKSFSAPAWERDSAITVRSNETTEFSNVALDTTEVAVITVGEYGIRRDVTRIASETTKLGAGGLLQFILEDGASLCNEALETALATLFASASNSVGSTGVDFSIADFVAAAAKLDTAKARGQKVCILDDQQAVDLRSSVAASGATVFANASTGAQSILNARSDAYMGELFGIPIALSNLCQTANTGADVVGVMMINGRANPKNAPICAPILRQPTYDTVSVPEYLYQRHVVSMAFGAGEVSDFNYCKIVTDA